jgi:phenylacetate-CoA ligase
VHAETLGEYVDRIEQFRPQAIQAYPSALLPLTLYLREQGRTIEGLRCVLTCSETLRSGQRSLTEEVMGCPIQDHYGTTERSALVMQCEKGRYHVIPEYGILELLDRDGEPVEEGTAGEIVVTGFINPAMPLIRYRTGDVAVRGSPECPCGRNYDVLERIGGRLQEYLVDRDGSLASAIWSDGPLWDLPDRVDAYQYVQDEPGRVTLNLEAGEGVTEASLDRIRRRFEKHYPRIAIEIREVDRIPRTERGKFRYVVQHLPLDDREYGNYA